MADFNVTCSISNLSIGIGDKVKFIPLLPSNFKDEKQHLIGVQPYLIYPNCYFNPLSLPISGSYDECGSIYKIIKDDNTKAIEKMFNMSIDDFIDAVTFGNTKGNKILESVSGMFVLEDVYDKLVNYNLKEVHSRFLGDLTEDTATILGFKKVSKKESKKQSKCESIRDIVAEIFNSESYEPKYETYRKEGFSYDLKIGSYGAKLVHQTDDSKNINYIYKVADLVKYWKNATNENLNAKSLQEENIFDVEYDSFRKKLTDYIKSKESIIKRYEDMLPSLYGKDKDLIEDAIKETKEEAINYDLKRGHKFMNIFKDWDFFEDLYCESIINGALKSEFTKFKAFYLTMHSCNKFLFPAMRGEQFGNPKASKKLLELQKSLIETALEKVNKEIEDESKE